MYLSLKGSLGHTPITDRVGENLLQIAEGASAAYSLRNLGSDSPAVVRVRRESDNAERDFTAQDINTSALVNWVNQQITPPLDLRELTATGRDGPIIDAAAAYSLRNLSDSYTGNVVEVRRNTDGALKDFKASEVTDGTLEAWVNTSFANALPLDTASGAAAAYSLRNLSTNYTGNVVDVRRSSDDAEDSFTAAEVADGTLTDWVSEDTTQYMQFDGVDDDISTSALLPATDDFTLTIEFIPDEVPASAMGLYGSLVGGSSGRHVFQINTSGQAFAFINGVTALTTANSINVGAINTFVLSKSGTNWSLSLNGGTADTATGSATLDTAGSNIGDPYSGINFKGIITSLSVGAITWDGSITDATSNGWTVNGSPTSTLLNDGFVSQWYDQSGNGNHAIQGTAASQPKIVDAGSLVSGGIDFDGTDDFFDITPISTSSTALSTFIFGDAQPSVFSYPIGNNNNAGIGVSSTQFRYNLISGTPIPEDWPSTLSGQNLYTFIHDGTTGIPNISGYRNGAIGSQTSASQGAAPSDFIRYIGTRNQVQEFDGVIGELIIYTSDQSDKRIAIEENIGSNYGITVTSSKDGTVSTWYDQSTTAGTPNANHAVQATPASQPKIVDAGSLVTGGLDFDGVDDGLDLPNVISSVNSASSFVVAKTTNASATQSALALSRNDPELARFYSPIVVSGNFYFGYGSSTTAINLGSSNTSDHLFTATAGSSTAEGFIDGISGGTVSSVDLYSQQSRGGIGNINGTTKWVGTIQEIVIYNTDQSTNRTAIEANIGEVYSIAGIPAYDDTVNGFVESWYDQSGNGNDVTQATSSKQPKIVNAGSLVTVGSKASLNFDGSDDFLERENYTQGTLSQPNTFFAVAKLDVYTDTGRKIFDGHNSSARNVLFLSTVRNGEFAHFAGTTQATGEDADADRHLFTSLINGASSSLRIDTAEKTTANTGTQDMDGIVIAANNAPISGFWDGDIQELIIYNSDQSANRAAIEANINNQYDIY